MPTDRLISHCYFKLAGNEAPAEVMNAVLDITVEEELLLPAMFVIRLHDPNLDLMDGDTFALGKEVIVEAEGGNGRALPIAAGEITALEPEFTPDGATLTVRGYDRLHRLTRGRKTKVFANMSDADIVGAIARDAGLKAECDSTTEKYDHVLQHNQSDWEFLLERARRIGFVVTIDGKTILFRKAPPESAPVELEWGELLSNLRLRQSAGGQVKEVIVRGWDAKNKKEITGKASSPRGLPRIGEARNGGAVIKDAFSAQPQRIVVERPVGTQGEADALAQALLDEIAGAHIQAEGFAAGNPELRAGAKVKLTSVGQRYGGDYTLTAVTHRYNATGYTTGFRASGRREQALLALMSAGEPAVGSQGAVVGVVTSIDDPDNRGRVKVRYPWLDGKEASIQSDWARVAGPGAGAERGICFMPEVDDEVLVVFEHGDMRTPYVIGGLWNGKDKPPAPPVKDKKVEKRTLKTRNGHMVMFTDEASGGKGAIDIKTADGKLIKLTDTGKGIEIKTDNHTVKLDDQGSLLSLESKGNLKIKADQKVTIEGQAGVEMKSSASVDIKGAMIKAQSDGMFDLKSSGIMNVQGSLVKIN